MFSKESQSFLSIADESKSPSMAMIRLLDVSIFGCYAFRSSTVTEMTVAIPGWKA